MSQPIGDDYCHRVEQIFAIFSPCLSPYFSLSPFALKKKTGIHILSREVVDATIFTYPTVVLHRSIEKGEKFPLCILSASERWQQLTRKNREYETICSLFFQVSEDPYHHLALFTKRLERETKRNDDDVDVDESSMDTYHHDQLANFLDQPVTPSPYDRCGWYSSESCNPCLFFFPSVFFLECTNHQRHHPLPSAILRVPVVHYRSTSNSYCA